MNGSCLGLNGVDDFGDKRNDFGGSREQVDGAINGFGDNDLVGELLQKRKRGMRSNEKRHDFHREIRQTHGGQSGISSRQERSHDLVLSGDKVLRKVVFQDSGNHSRIGNVETGKEREARERRQYRSESIIGWCKKGSVVLVEERNDGRIGCSNKAGENREVVGLFDRAFQKA